VGRIDTGGKNCLVGGCSCKSSIIPMSLEKSFRSLCHRKAKSDCGFHKAEGREGEEADSILFPVASLRSSNSAIFSQMYRQSSDLPVSRYNISRNICSDPRSRIGCRCTFGVSDGSSSRLVSSVRSAPPSATTVALCSSDPWFLKAAPPIICKGLNT